jgi:outer membrane receptor protein involved in Fe transport
MNLRFAGFRSVTRPDPRDLSLDQYTPVGSECVLGGDTTVVETRTINADARWEYYPRGGELFAVSGFYKEFTNPLVEVISGNGGSGCVALPANAESAKSYGVELEARRALDFLPGFLKYLSFGANATILGSSVVLDPVIFGPKEKGLDLQGQSPFLLNAGLNYGNPDSKTSASLLVNYFGDRVARYGGQLGLGEIPPNVIEMGRYSLVAKFSQGWGPVRFSLSGTNLTNQRPKFVVEHTSRITRTSTIGTSWTLGFSYDVY